MKNGKQKKQKKKKNKIVSFFVFLLGIVAVTVILAVGFYIQDVKVTGNEFYSSSEIRKEVLDDSFSVNSLYVYAKYRIGKGTVPQGIESVKISLISPWELCIDVKEKERIACIKSGAEYICIDQNGLVLQKEKSQIMDLPLLEGLELGKTTLYQVVEIKNENVFQKMIELCFELKKYQLESKKIQCKGERVYSYIGNICVSFGNDTSAEKVAQIPGILEKLGDEKGILHLENYSDEHNIITFEKEKKKEEN